MISLNKIKSTDKTDYIITEKAAIHTTSLTAPKELVFYTTCKDKFTIFMKPNERSNMYTTKDPVITAIDYTQKSTRM